MSERMAGHVTKVFISATSADLRSVRGLVKDALLNMGCLPVVQEHFPPDYRDVSGMLRDKIGGCDALIHIAGMRYGAEPDPATLPEGTPRRSYTQMEVDLARELGLEKVFTFVCPESFPYETTDAAGDELKPEPEELQQLQQAHRERLLAQQKLRYRVDSPEELGSQVRELQLELAEVKGELVKTRGKMLRVGAVIAAALMLLVGGLWWVSRDTGAIKKQQAGLSEEFERIHQAPRVLAAYQDRFREIRDIGAQGAKLSNALIDAMVRSELPGIVGLPEEIVTEILEVEVIRLAGDAETKTEDLLKALFVMEEFDAVLEKGEAVNKERIEAMVDSLQTMGDAALAKFENDPALKWKEKALELYTQALALVSVDDSPEKWASSSILLANQYTEVGNYEAAEPLYRDALKVAEQTEGRESPNTLIVINHLGRLLRVRGDFEAAEPLLRESLNGLLQTLGRAHPHTLFAKADLAELLRLKSDLDGAEKLMEEAYQISAQVFGWQQPGMLLFVNNLALVHFYKGNYEAAALRFREALETSQRVLGREHPNTLIVLNNLAETLRNMGSLEEAGTLYVEVLKARERVLGNRHPDTLVSKFNLAGWYFADEDYAAAEPLYREAAEGFEGCFGRSHPQTIASIGGLAQLLQAKGDYDAADSLYLDMILLGQQELGREHPFTLTAINNRAGLLCAKGQYSEALPLMREALTGFEKALGENHPRTQVVRRGLDALLSILAGADQNLNSAK